MTGHDGCHLGFHIADRLDIEVLNQHPGNIRREECRHCRPKADMLDNEGEQCQKNHCLLLVPGDIVGNRQVVNIIKAEDLFQLQGDLNQRIGIVAQTGVENLRDATDITEVQLVVAVLGATGGEGSRVLRQSSSAISVK